MIKGISPLVAAVLLIAVTMTIAGVLAYWASTFIGTEVEAFDDESVANECNFGRFRIDACTYDSANQRATFILDNIGTVELLNISVYAVYPDNGINVSFTNTSLSSNQLKSFTANSISPGFVRLSMRTHCPTVIEETTCR